MSTVLTKYERSQLEAYKLCQAVYDPVQTAEQIFGVELWQGQVDILTALKTKPRIAVKACHSSSKSFTAAIAVLWWLLRWDEGTALTTAPTWRQVNDILWSEIHRVAKQSKVAFPKMNKTGASLSDKNFALGLSTNDSDRFQGYHNTRMLIVMDEAVGINDDIWKAVEANKAGGDVTVLALANPTVTSGKFFDIFSTQRELWDLHTIDAFNTPNFVGITPEQLMSWSMDDERLDQSPKKYLITRRWVWEIGKTYGVDSAYWQARVRGRFPSQGSDCIMSIEDLERARVEVVDLGGPVQVGIDVAGPGEDETVVCIRQKSKILLLKSFPDADPRGKVVALLNPYKSRIERIKVDSIGIGYNFAHHLQDLEFVVEFVNVGESATDSARFLNLKAENYWALRETFQDGVEGLMDEIAIGQLSGIKYMTTSNGKIKIESKDDARKRGVRSPDRAEAIMLAFAPPRFTGGENIIGYYAGILAKNEEIEDRNIVGIGVPDKLQERYEKVTVVPKTKIEEKGAKLYEEAYMMATGVGKPVCKGCGLDLGSQSVSNGIEHWHPDCFKPW